VIGSNQGKRARSVIQNGFGQSAPSVLAVVLAREARLSLRAGLANLEAALTKDKGVNRLSAWRERIRSAMGSRKQFGLDVAKPKIDVGKPSDLDERLSKFH